MPCLDQLRCTAEAGHKISMYALTLFLYRPNSNEATDDEARWLLRLVEGPEEGATTLSWKNLTCTKRRSRIISAKWHLRPSAAVAVPPVPALVPRQGNLQCAGRGCGNHAGWHASYPWCRFCSEECRIQNKCDWFLFTLKEACNVIWYKVKFCDCWYVLINLFQTWCTIKDIQDFSLHVCFISCLLETSSDY
jgi:hypothetical protein